ncbi:MAG: hypothetical protein ABIJ97_05075, partial [Bacteroidota bacterium]
MKKILFILTISLFSFTAFSQTYNISSQGTESTCTGTLTLGSCTIGNTYVFTLCSDDIPSGNTHISVALNTYDMDNGGSFCVYDGDNTGAPSLGCNTNFQVPWAITASPANTSGCLTFEYTPASGDALSATIHCNFQCQNIQAEIASTTPAATLISGIYYIDVCQGQQITLNGSATYQNTTYPQSNGTSTFEWTFSDLTVLTGQTINWTPPTDDGYTVSLLVTDALGCESTNSIIYRIRVSRTPDFTGSDINPHVICQGDPVTLSGTVTSDQWISAPPTAFANPLFLPDGTGVSYNTSINVVGFDPGQTLTNINDLLGICMNIEHSYIGDLVMYIACPSGQSVQLESQGGGGVFLGDANDASSTPGTGWDYCFTNTPTYGTLAATASAGITVPVSQGSALPSGSYASFQPLSGLVGCDLNGTWTITIIDNWAIDDGWIFSWWIDFNPSLYPSLWDYQNTYVNHIWTANIGSGGSITSNNGTGGGEGTYVTGLFVQTNEPFYYTITDDFGCTYDTTIMVTVLPADASQCCIIPVINMVTTSQTLCGNSILLDAGTISTTGNVGTWTNTGPGTVNFVTGGIHDIQSFVNVSTYGTYTFTWTEVNNGSPACTDAESVTITFLQEPTANAGLDNGICGYTIQLNGNPASGGETGTWTSSPSGASFSPNANTPNATVTVTGVSISATYLFTWTIDNGTCSNTDEVKIVFYEIPVPNAGPDDNTCGNSYPLDAVNSPNVGYWSGPPEVSFTNIYDPDATAIVSNIPGTQVSYTLTWHETNGVCSGQDNVVITFIEPPLANAGYGGAVCDYDFQLAANTLGVNFVSASWSTNVAGITISQPGNDTTLVDIQALVPGVYNASCVAPIYFTFTITNSTNCTSVDSVLVEFFQNSQSFAGTNDSVCGLVYTMQAVPSIDCSIGQWNVISQPAGSSPANFTPVSSPNSLVTATAFGYWEFVWTEWNQSSPVCITKDTVRIHFIEKPTIDAGPRDTVCGHWVQMNATTSGYAGTWITPGGGYVFASGPSLSLEDTSYQHVYNTWLYYNQLGDSAKLVWRECMGFCCSYDTVMVLFDEEFPAVHLVTMPPTKECGKITTQLNAQTPAQGSSGYWFDETPLTNFVQTAYSTHPDYAQVTYYGTHNFHWVVMGEFETCRDTTEAIPIQFIEPPTADAGPEWDTVCGYSYELNPVDPAVGTGFWTSAVMTPGIVWFETTNTWTSTEMYDTVTTSILNIGGSNPYYNIIWNVQNDICTDADTIRLIFVPEPTGDFMVRHPYCIGDVGVLTAGTTGPNVSIIDFTWDIGNGLIDSTQTDFTDMNPVYVYWSDATEDQEHTITLVAENVWGCRSDLSVDIMQEPPAMAPPMAVIDATCGNVNGQIIFLTDTGEYMYAWMVDTAWFATTWTVESGGIGPPDSIFVTTAQDSIFIYNITGDSTYYFVVQGESQSYSPAPIGTFCIEG